MSSVIEVKPTGWQNNGQGLVGSPPGNDVRSVFMDKDGATVWALQSITASPAPSAGFARIKLSDGSILFSGNWNNSTGTTLQGLMHAGGTPFWIQIGTNYFVLDYSTSILHKMTVSPSAVGSWGNGYLTDAATLDLTTNLPHSSNDVGAFATANIGGINYIAISLNGASGGKNLIVVNADSMTLVGTWTHPTVISGESINAANCKSVFFDKFGKVWVVSVVFPTTTDPNNFKHGMFLSTGDPATPSGLVTTFVPAGSLPANFFKQLPDYYATYNTNNHSVIVGVVLTNTGSSDQAMMAVDLVSKTSISSRFSLGVTDWWDSFNQAGNYCAFLIGIQADGMLNVQAGTGDIVTTFSPSLSKLNPVTFAQVSVTDVTAAINNSTVADKVPAFASGLTFSGIAFNSSFVVVSFSGDSNADFNGGSPVYIVSLGLCGAPTPLGNPFLRN